MESNVFISYSSHDKSVAEAVCHALEARKAVCWMAPRDVVPGALYGEAIIDALQTVQIMVLILSAHSNRSPQVIREVERAGSKGLPIIPFLIERITLSKSIEFFVSTHHWLDASVPPLDVHLEKVAETVGALLQHVGVCGAASSPAQCEFNVTPFLTSPQFDARHATDPVFNSTNTNATDFQNWRMSLEQGHLTTEIDARRSDDIVSISRVVSEVLVDKGFSKADGKKASIALSELLTNVNNYVASISPVASVDIQLSEPSYKAHSVSIKVSDRGPGFNLEAELLAADRRLGEGHREHGLLRSFRLGTVLKRLPGADNTLEWETKSTVNQMVSMFDAIPSIVPVIFDFDTDFLRIAHDIMPFETFAKLAMTSTERVFSSFDRRREAVLEKPFLSNTLKLAFEPLRRLRARNIVLHVTGQHPTYINNKRVRWLSILVYDFVTTVMSGSRFVIFADAESEDNSFLLSFSRDHALPCFESAQECLQHFETVMRASP